MTLASKQFLYKVQYLSYFVFRAFLIAIFCLLVLLGIFFAVYFGDLFINVKSGNYSSPIFNGYVIVSQSMVPTININDAIVVKRETNDKYNIGDIISFFSTEYDKEGIIITHRIIDKRNIDDSTSNYRTKGDNNPVADRKNVTTSNIYGKVFLIIPKLGYVQSFLSQPVHFIICIIIPAIIVIIYDGMRIVGALRRARENY